MNRVSDGRDGMLVWWDAAEVDRSLFCNAMYDSGLGAHTPEAVNKRAALKNVLADTVSQFGLTVHGQRVKYEPLAEPVLGFEAVRVVKGVEANEYPSLFSAALSTTLQGESRVRLVRNHPLHGFLDATQWLSPDGRLMRGAEAAEEFASLAYQRETELIPGAEAGRFLKEAILGGLSALSLSRHSKAYFVPAVKAPAFETLAIKINSQTPSHGLRLSWFRYEMEPVGFEQMIAALRTEICELTAAVNEELGQCKAEDRRMRSDAVGRRVTSLDDAHDKLAVYERLLGVSLDELRSAIEQTQGMLAMQAMLAVSA